MVLTPKGDEVFPSMLNALDMFTDDFMADVEDMPLQERAANAYDCSVAEGIATGLRQLDEGDFMTHEESRAARFRMQ